MGNIKKKTHVYRWLRKALGLKKEETHIGMFDVDMCKKVIEKVQGYKRRNPDVYEINEDIL